jgi:hypothetical protein
VKAAVVARLEETLDLTDSLAASLDDEVMNRRLQDRANTLWDQFWCIIGARESYGRAIAAGGWVGFDCSLSSADRGSQLRVVEVLQSSRSELARAVSGSSPSAPMVLDLLLHETQHHGQLIRFIYAFGLEIPKGWRDRWSL